MFIKLYQTNFLLFKNVYQYRSTTIYWPSSKSKRDAEIENAALRLKRTPSVNDRSAPKLQ